MFWTITIALILSFEVFRLFELRRWTGLYFDILTLTETTPETLAEVMRKAGRIEPWAELLVLAGLTGLLFTSAWFLSLVTILLTVLKELFILGYPAVRREAAAGRVRLISAALLADGILTILLLALALLVVLKRI